MVAKNVLGPDGWLGPARVVTAGEAISMVEPLPNVPADSPHWLVPGFIDLQVNGKGALSVAELDQAGWTALSSLLAQEGVTSWCPNLITAGLHVLEERLERLVAFQAATPVNSAQSLGVHVEGPFLGSMPGVHPVVHIAEPDVTWLESQTGIALVTIGAEHPDSAALAATATEMGITVSLGHTVADAESWSRMRAAGASMVTHGFNTSGPLHHRDPGLMSHALVDDDVAVCLIVDGVHVHPQWIEVAFRTKPNGMAVLVTDAVAGERVLGDRRVELTEGAWRDDTGRLAGSALTMNGAVRNAVRLCNIAPEDAFVAASAGPASALGYTDRGTLEPGKRADVVALDEDFNVVSTCIGGSHAA